MQVPKHYFSFHSWPTPIELVELAEKRRSFVRDGGITGLWYGEHPGGEEDTDAANPSEEMVQIAWMAICDHESDVETFIPESEYLTALESHLRDVGEFLLADRVVVFRDGVRRKT